MRKFGPIWVETRQGEPIVIGDRELIPTVRIFSFIRRRGVVRKSNVEGKGMGIALLKPVEIWEHTPRGRRRIPVHDATSLILLAMFLIGLILPFIFKAHRTQINADLH